MKAFEYDKKDVPQFQKEACPECVLKGQCINEGKNEHWFLMCPHYHQWKLGYKTNFIQEQLKWQMEHPEENEKAYQERVEAAKRYKKVAKQNKK